MSENEKRNWRQRQRDADGSENREYEHEYEYDDEYDDDGRDHIDYMLEHGRLQATCKALEAALAQTSTKLREVDAKASARIRYLEMELRRERGTITATTTTDATRPRSMISSSSTLTSFALAGRSPSPTSLGATRGLRDDGDHDDEGAGWMRDPADIIEDGRGTSMPPNCDYEDDDDGYDNDDDDGYDNDGGGGDGGGGLVRTWDTTARPSSTDDEYDDEYDEDGSRRRRSTGRHRIDMVRRRLPHVALVLALSALVVALFIGIAITIGMRGLRRSEEAIELATEAGYEVGEGKDGDLFGAGYVVGIEDGSSLGENATSPTSLSGNDVVVPDPPVWYSTTHRHYQEILKSKVGGSYHNDDNLTSDIDPHVVAVSFCRHIPGMRLCDYDAYCPDGRGSMPYGDGPPGNNSTNVGNRHGVRERIAQWAPFLLPDEDDFGGVGGGDGEGGRATLFGDDVPRWVQVGRVPTEMGGNDENDYARCWTYADWYDATAGGGGGGGGNGVGDIDEIWEGRHRLWMMCCPI